VKLAADQLNAPTGAQETAAKARQGAILGLAVALVSGPASLLFFDRLIKSRGVRAPYVANFPAGF
jgi:hypothetical protein